MVIDAYILVEGRIKITGTGDDAAARHADRRGKCVIFKNCAPFINFKSEINNTEIDHAKDIDITVPIYSLIEYSDIYSKTSGSLSECYKDKSKNNSADSESFKWKVKIIGKTLNNGNTKEVEIIVPLKHLCNFWRTLEIPLINGKVNLILTWSSSCVITNLQWIFVMTHNFMFQL